MTLDILLIICRRYCELGLQGQAQLDMVRGDEVSDCDEETLKEIANFFRVIEQYGGFHLAGEVTELIDTVTCHFE